MLGRQKARGLFRGIQLDHKGFVVVFRFMLFSKDHLVWKINLSDWKTCQSLFISGVMEGQMCLSAPESNGPSRVQFGIMYECSGAKDS